MCGRYTIRLLQPVVDMFGFELPPDFPADFPPRYNIAPTEEVPVVRSGGADAPSARRLDLLHWGLVPSWADDPSVGNRMINARAETAAERPAFRDAMRRRRCLVPADGFYEWKKLDTAPGAASGASREKKGGKKGGRKQPYLFRMKGDRPFAFAGLWDTWRRGDEALESFTILTTSANELVSPVHDRMPVIVAAKDFSRWLDPKLNASDVQDLVGPYPVEEMEAVPVSSRVNSPAYDDEGCIAVQEVWR